MGKRETPVYSGLNDQRHPLPLARLPETPAAAAGPLAALLVAVLPQASPLVELCQGWQEMFKRSLYVSSLTRPDCPIFPSVPSCSELWLAPGTHSPLWIAAKLGVGSQVMGKGRGGGSPGVQNIQHPWGPW